jgi:hypothetical protein
MKAATHADRLGDAAIEPHFIDLLNGLAGLLDTALNGAAKGAARENGFVLLVFPFDGRKGRANYISNAQRADVLTLLKEQVARFEGQPELAGKA